MKPIRFIISLLFLTSCIKGKKVDFLFHNTIVNSCDENNHTYEAIAIKDGKIIELGPERQILNKYRSEESEDLGGKYIYPTLIDANFKLFDILIERFSIQTSLAENEKHLIYLIEKKLETTKSPILSINSARFSKKKVIDLIIQNFPSKRIYIENKDSLFYIENKSIKTINNNEKRTFKTNLLKTNFIEFKALFLEIQNELIEHGFNDIIVHNCSKEEFDFLTKLEKNINIEMYLYTNYIEKHLAKKHIYVNGFYLDEFNHLDSEKISKMNKPISFTSSFFQANSNQLYKLISSINQDHRWVCIINSKLSNVESEKLNQLNIYPVVNSTSSELEKTNFLRSFGSGNTNPFEMELEIIKDNKIAKNQKNKLLFSNGHKLTFNENRMGSLEKKKNTNFITFKFHYDKINSTDKLYIDRMYIKNKLMYQVD